MAARGELLGVDKGEHRFARDTDHDDDEPGPAVSEVVGGLIVDEVATWLPEGLPCAKNALGLAFKLEDHLALEHVAEDGAGVANASPRRAGAPQTVFHAAGRPSKADVTVRRKEVAKTPRRGWTDG